MFKKAQALIANREPNELTPQLLSNVLRKLPIVHQLRATLHAFSDRRSRRLSERAKKANRARYRRWLILGEPLEDRALLAGFTVSGSTLALNLTAANESVAITSAGSTYAFVLTGGTWSGTDGGGATGNGLTTLTATAASFTDVTVDDSSTGNGVNFNDSGANTYTSSFTITMDSASPGGSTLVGKTAFTSSAALFVQAVGIAVNPGAAISTVNGNLTLLGNMQTPNSTGNGNGVNINAATISVSGSGNLTIKGTSRISTSTQMGVRIQGGSSITGGTVGSTLVIEGYGAASSGTNYGLNIKDSGTAISSLGGNVALKGVGGTGSSSGNHGVFLEASTTTSAGGAGSLSIVAVPGTGGVGLSTVGGSVVSTTGTGNISIATDSASLAGSVSSPGRTVSVAPLTAGKIIDIGSTSDAIANTLALSQTELNTITASTLNIGDANTATTNASANITRPGGTTTNVTAAAINLNGNTITGGTVNLILTGRSLISVEQPAGTSNTSGMTKSFGSVVVGSTADLVFTVKNPGSGNLTGLDITIDGTNAAEFTVFASPAAPVAPGGSTTFTIRHSPVTAGNKTAAFHLTSNALGVLNFDVNLTASSLPDIIVEQPEGTVIADGGTMSFGGVPVGSTADRIFTVKNPGTSDLAISGITIDGANASEFSIIAAPSASVLVSGSTTFAVRYSPTTIGNKTAALHIANNVAGAKNPFDINLTASSTPDISVEHPVGTAIADGGTKAFGGVAIGGSTDLLFTVRNPGTSDLAISGITFDGANASEFSVAAAPASSVSVSGTTTFTVRYTPTSVGSKVAALHVATNVPGAKSAYDISLATTAFSATPISGTKTLGPTGDYASLTNAIADIQGAGLSGPIVIELQPAYVSTVESFPLVFSNLGTTAVNTLTVRPATGATNLLISSADTTAATVDLNNAQFVTIDGRPGGVGSNTGSGVGTASQLTIANTSTSGVAVRFINEASNNTILYTTLRGVNTSFVNGVILFSTTTGTSGNDNNTIDQCDIRDGATTPNNGLTSLGSTGTAAQANSGNTVLNSNIFNFYTSAATDSVGLRLDVGNSDWSISGNSFYQTATRSGNTSTNNPARAIFINSPVGNNFAVTGNFIGGDSPGAAVTTQKWTAGGTGVAYRFNAIQLNVGSTTASSVQGNTIANIAWTTNGAVTTPGNGPFTGIYVVAGNVNIGTVTGNTIGSGTGTGSISVTTSGSGGTSFGIGSASSGTVAITGNSIGSITVNGSAATVSASLVGIQVTAGTNTISNNAVGSTTTANSLNAATLSTSTTAQMVTGILSSSTSSTSITDNTVANLNNNYNRTSATVGQIRGIVTSDGVNTITGNTVRNLSTRSQNNNSTTAQSVYGIIDTSTVAGQTVSQNTVHSLANTATGSVAVSVTGIYFAGPTSGTNVIARNFVHSLAVSSTSAASAVNGLQFVAGTFTAQNNMVRVGLSATGASTAPAAAIRGIYDNGTTAGRNFYHNSVYVGGTQTAAAANTFGFVSTGTTNNRAYQNNILFNARSNSGGTGKHYAVNYGGTIVNPTGLKAGGNILLASGTGGVLGLYNSVDRTTLALWQAATGQDTTSYNVDPRFINPTGTADTVDLHLQASNPAERGGVVLTDALTGAPATVTDDFDGQTRSTLTPVDIGSDAGNFLDVTSPLLSYPLLSNGTTVNRVLTGWATITDNVGVSSGANAPRLYFKKSTDADVFGGNTSADNGWKYVTTTTSSGSGPHSFTLDYSLINGGSVSLGDTIQYFVVAQDAANNFVSSPLGATASANPPVQNINAKAGTVNSFSIVPTISGTKTVGTGGDYPSLSGPGGLFAALNASALTGNVVVNIISDLTETGGATLNEFNATEYPATGYTLTLQPDSATMRTISGTSTAGLITLNGADRVTIDGRFGGSGRFLTFRNTSTATTASTILFINDASNNTLRNCVVEGATTSGTLGVIGFSTGTVTGNDNNLINDCQVRDLTTAAGVPTNLIGSFGTSAAVSNSGNTISNNEMFNFNQNGIFILSSGNESWTISANNIYEVTAISSSRVGILSSANGSNVISDNYIHDLSSSGTGTNSIYAGGSGTTTIARNRIVELNSSSSATGIVGIFLQGASTSTITVMNNQICIIPSAAFSSDIRGYNDNSQGGVVEWFYNTVVIGGTETGSNNSWAARYNPSSIKGATVRNNLFLNLRTGGTGTHFAASLNGSVSNFTFSNNVYAGTGVTAANFMDRGSGPVSFATWQSSTGDTSTSASNPGGNYSTAMFVSAATGDLHLVPGGNVLVNGTGTPIPEVTTDYDGDLRSLTAPNIGSDEFAAPNTAPTAVVLSPSSASLAESANTTSATELSTITITDDGAGTNTLSLSGADAASFEIVAGKLYLKAGVTLDYETKTSYSVTVHVDDSTVGNTPDASATFTLSITNVTELTGIDVQKGQKQRSFVRNVDILFDSEAGLTDMLSNNRVKLTRFDLNGLNPTAMTLPTGSVSGNQIQLDFGAQGIGGNRSSNVGDGYYQTAIDMDGDGLFESIKHFFRLYGDVTGDGLVDSRDKAQVLSMSGTTNVEGDLNGDGVVNLADTTAVSRAVGRKLKAGLTWDD